MIVSLLALTMTVVLGGFMAFRYRAGGSILEPGIFFAANLLVLYPIRLVVLWLFQDDSFPSYFEVLEESALERAGLLALLATIAYVTGYLLVLRGKNVAILDSRRWRFGRKDVRLIWLFMLMSLIGTAYLVVTGDYISYLMAPDRNPALSQIAHLFSTFQWAGFIGVWILFLRRPRAPWVAFTLLIVVLLVVPYQFIQGSKTFLSLLVVSTVVAYVWERRRVPLLMTAASVAFVFLFVFPFVQQFRDYVNVEYGQIPAISKFRLDELGRLRLREGDEEGTLWSSVLKSSSRYAGIDELHNLDRMVPEYVDYRYGRDFLAIAYNVIPRALWPSKPQYSRGADYGAALGTVTSVTPFPFGEALWQLGVLGMMPMMALWGIALASIVRGIDWLCVRADSPLFVVALFLSQIYWIAGGESSLAGVLSGIPQLAVLYGAAYWIARRIAPNSIGRHTMRRASPNHDERIDSVRQQARQFPTH